MTDVVVNLKRCCHFLRSLFSLVYPFSRTFKIFQDTFEFQDMGDFPGHSRTRGDHVRRRDMAIHEKGMVTG